MKKFCPLKALCRYFILIFIFSGFALSSPGQNSPRKIEELSNEWKFLIDVQNIGEKEKWFSENSIWNNASKAKVPGAWDLMEEGMWQYEGVGWYQTNIKAENFTAGKRNEIIFNRVMFHSKVWLNGEYLGENLGGYLPFSFNLSEKLKQGRENSLVVRVDNKYRIEWLPASGQVEWVQYGGILDPVELISTEKTYISDLTVITTPENNGAKVTCSVDVSNESESDAEMELSVKISGPSGTVNKSIPIKYKSGEHRKTDLDLLINKPDLWSPEQPVLYKVAVNLKKDGAVIDDLVEKIGIRNVKAQRQSILLNGKPFIVRGVNRYDEYGPYGPNPPEKLLREELALMKKVGINTIRVHYPQSPKLLSLYDEFGFVMLEEVPLNWWGVKWFGDVKQTLDMMPQAREALTKMIKRDKNHPCIIIWSMANECETTNEVGTTAMRELLKMAKKLDSTRLVTYVSNSDVADNPAYEDADVVCINMYNGSLSGKICNHISEIDSLGYKPFVSDLTRHRSYYQNKPLFLTEFGTRGVMSIHGDINSSEEFQAAYIERIWQGIRDVPGVSGGVLWSWADYYHRKYLITYAAYGPYGAVTVDRKPKKALEALSRMYTDKELKSK